MIQQNLDDFAEDLLYLDHQHKVDFPWPSTLCTISDICTSEECGGSVVKCLTRDRGVAGLSLTGGTALCP